MQVAPDLAALNAVEQRVLWLATAMVHHANRDGAMLGAGRQCIKSYAVLRRWLARMLLANANQWSTVFTFSRPRTVN